MHSAHLGCRCGAVSLTAHGPHIATVECLCASCQTAGQALGRLPDATPVLDSKGATHFVMHRKDRVTITAGQDKLRAHRLSPSSSTRRVLATCCNTPIFLEFMAGHWLSLYAALWPKTIRPAVEMRTMTGSRDDLPGDVPNLRTHSFGFYGRLFGAWAAMGFRKPKLADIGDLHG